MSVRGVSGLPKLRLLLDTNVFIALEPYAGSLEPRLEPATRLVRLASEQGHRLFVHPANEDDLRQGSDSIRLSQQLAELKKFDMLIEGPIPTALIKDAGASPSGSNDHRDLRLLAALKNRAVEYLVSDDAKLRKRAAGASLGESVLTVDEVVALLDGFTPTVSPPPPRVERIPPYALDCEQAIFETLRADYAGFDAWLDKVRADADNRDCLVVRGDDGCYAGIALIKRVEADCAYGFPQPVTKIATFKVAPGYAGSKYGELLLKTVFVDAHDRRIASLYVEVLDKYQALIDLLADFGFTDSVLRSTHGELVVVKHCLPSDGGSTLSTLEYHVRYGPPAILSTGRVFIVPIKPEWHHELFPDAPGASSRAEQLMLPWMALTHPWGNALRKAYLSNSKINKLARGDTLLFYQSVAHQSVTAIGVVEATVRSADPREIISFVGGRTVYTPAEIAGMCGRVAGVLAILFRQDRFIDPPWERAELQDRHVIADWPQSITEVRGEGAAWVHQQLSE